MTMYIISFLYGYPLCPCTATPNSPVITAVNSFNTSISLNWTHDRACFESVPVEYHVLATVNTANQSIITDQLMVEIDGVISGTIYTISVMAVADGTQRSEADSVSITTGGYSNNYRHVQKREITTMIVCIIHYACISLPCRYSQHT